jgi:hypothetical protein
VLPRGELKRVRDLLGNNDVVTNSSPLDESLLSRVNVIREMRFQSVGNAFGYDFVNHVAKTDRSEISGNSSDKLFRNKGNVSVVGFIRKVARGEKVYNELVHFITNPVPGGKIKLDIKTIWARRGVPFHII